MCGAQESNGTFSIFGRNATMAYVENGGMREKKRRKSDLAVATQGFSKLLIIIHVLPRKEWLL